MITTIVTVQQTGPKEWHVQRHEYQTEALGFAMVQDKKERTERPAMLLAMRWLREARQLGHHDYLMVLDPPAPDEND